MLKGKSVFGEGYLIKQMTVPALAGVDTGDVHEVLTYSKEIVFLFFLDFISFRYRKLFSLKSHHLFPLSHSLLFLQLHHSVRSAALSELPPGVRQQHALRVADHLQPREPNQSGLQRPQHGEAV